MPEATGCRSLFSGPEPGKPGRICRNCKQTIPSDSLGIYGGLGVGGAPPQPSSGTKVICGPRGMWALLP